MSATDSHTVDPAKPHPSGNMGHEMSDFSWTTVLWLLPISAIILLAFAVVTLLWFRGAKDSVVAMKQSQTLTEELDLHRTQEAEFLNQYKWLDKEKGKIRIPIQRAMELMVAEGKDAGTVEWKPVSDNFIRSNAFAQVASGEVRPQATTPVAAEVAVPEAKAAHPAKKAH